MPDKWTTDGIAGYVRLSRAEVKELGTFEEKVERHKSILLRIAEAHRIPLTREQIVVEIKSGEKLSTRPGILGLLERARRGQLKVLVAMAVDRLTRSIVDQSPIADDFFAGEVLLVTQEGKTLFDQNLDITPWQMKAMIAQWERDRYSFRRKVHNEERATHGQRSSGYAPYGYKWQRPLLSEDGRRIVEPGHYVVIAAEYEIVEELFRRIWTEGISTIQRDLNRRLRETGAPAPPSHGRREDVANSWGQSTLYRIFTNPHYSGFPAHRQAMQRGKGRTRLAQSEWVFAATEQDYPHPLAGLEAWYELQAQLRSRRSTCGGNARQGVLTRILRCPNGRPMHLGGPNQYACDCKGRGMEHPGSYMTASRAEAVALKALEEAFASLPLDALPSIIQATDRKALTRQRAAAIKERDAEEHLASELMKNASLIISLYGDEDFKHKAEANKRALDAARLKVLEVEAQIAQPDLAEKRALLERIAAIGGGDVRLGTRRLWEIADYRQRREMINHVIAELRMRPAPARRKQCREVEVVLRPFYAEHAAPSMYDVTALCPHYQTKRAWCGAGRVERPCSRCGKAVYRKPSDNGAAHVFCSRECYQSWRAGKRSNGQEARGRTAEAVSLTCTGCGETFERPKGRRAYQTQFCTRACYGGWLSRQAHP